MAGMKSDHYFVITGLMCNEMGLSGNELMIYAIIRGFSQDGESRYTGGRGYLANTLNISKPTVDKALNSLIRKGYIIKIDASHHDCQYYEYMADLEAERSLTTSKETLQGEENNFTGDSKEILQGESKNFTGGSKETLHNNIKENTEEKKKESIDNIKKTRFVAPTIEDIRAYCLEIGSGIDAEYFYDYYNSNGWMAGKNHMKDWKATVRNWERRQKKDQPRYQKQAYVNPFTELKRQEGLL